MAAPTVAPKRWLARLTNDNASRRVLPDRRRRQAVAEGVPVIVDDRRHGETEVLGVNSRRSSPTSSGASSAPPRR